MKRYFILTLLLYCSILQGFAFDYTDENGVTWSCEFTDIKYNEDGSRIDYVSLTGASNYGPEVIVPEKVYDGETAYPVKTLYNTFRNSTITKVTLPKDSIIIDGAFESCYNLSDVANSNFIKECCIGAFQHTALTSIDLSGCKHVHGFFDCQKLESVILKVCQTIQAMAFINCSKLKSLGETSSITEIGTGAFSGCSSLQSIDLSNCTIFGSEWTGYGGIFNGCASLKEVKLPKTLTDIPNRLFSGCSGLTSFDFSNVTYIGESAFEGSALTNIVRPQTIKQIANNAFRNCSNLKSIDFGNVTSIGESAFEGCINLDSITLPSSITSIGRNAFTNINYVTINAAKVPSLEGNFGTNSIVLVPNEALNAYRTANVWKDFAGQILAIGTKLDYDVKTTAQDNAPGLLQQLDRDKLNSIVTLKVSGTINSYDIMIFRNKMDNLHYLDLSDATIVANPYEYYTGYSSLNDIIGEFAFHNQKKLVSIKLPNNLKQIRSQAFEGCCNLKDVTFPNNKDFKFEGQNSKCN